MTKDDHTWIVKRAADIYGSLNGVMDHTETCLDFLEASLTLAFEKGRGAGLQESLDHLRGGNKHAKSS